MSRDVWSYDGEAGVMTLCNFYGEPVFNLKLDFPTAHALAQYIAYRDKEAREAARSDFFDQIARLAGHVPGSLK